MIRIPRVFRALILAGGIAGLTAGVTVPPAQAAPLPFGTFRLATSSPDYAGTCASSNHMRGQPYIMDFCRAYDYNEQWVYGTQGFYQSLVNVDTGNCATATSRSEGAQVVDMPCSSANVANQSWVTNPLGVIALAGPPHTVAFCWIPVNYKIQLTYCTGNINQVWTAVPTR
ncbi:MAG: RICIN domain-containing protein [Streptosporangiaceae bacterium]|nr:RICIN domain-containing protein [Streptosporangiaceae bacterium]